MQGLKLVAFIWMKIKIRNQDSSCTATTKFQQFEIFACSIKITVN